MHKFQIALILAILTVGILIAFIYNQFCFKSIFKSILETELHSNDKIDIRMENRLEEPYSFYSRRHREIMEKARASMNATFLSPTCKTNKTIGNLGKLTHRLNISENDETRLSQLLKPTHMQLSEEAKTAIEHMRRQLPGSYETIIATGASENHYLESQYLIKEMHTKIFPILKNFTLVFYNLGLTRRHRTQYIQYCNCTVIDFPFELFPRHFDDLHCYTWKPFIVAALIKKANTFIWMDSSVRFEKMKNQQFLEIMKLTKEKGLMAPAPSVHTPFHTQSSMYHWFGDEPCAYLEMEQVHATLVFFKRDRFIQRAVIDVWTTCAWDVNCMCPPHFKYKQTKNNYKMATHQERLWLEGKEAPVYNLRHLYDQSALSIIIEKLLFRYYKWHYFKLDDYNIKFRKNTKIHYFPT